MKSLSTPDSTIQKDIQPAPTPMKPLLEVFTTSVNPIVLYTPLPIIKPPLTDTHAIPWVYQAPNQDNQGEVSNPEGFLDQPEVARQNSRF